MNQRLRKYIKFFREYDVLVKIETDKIGNIGKFVIIKTRIIDGVKDTVIITE